MMELIELDEIELELSVINTLKTIPLIKTVSGTYPQNDVKDSEFPISIVTMVSSPVNYDFGKNELITRVRVTIDVYGKEKSTTLRIIKEVEKELSTFGFNRQSRSDILLDQTKNKYYIKQNFVINYNKINGKLERAI